MHSISAIAALVLAACPGDARAQSSAPPAPRTTFDAGQQSVVILDDAPPRYSPHHGFFTAIASPLTTAQLPDYAPYQPGQQFQLLDAPRPQPHPAIADYNNDVPMLAPHEPLGDDAFYHCQPCHWQLLPQGLIWHSYLAGPKEPRLMAALLNDPNLGTKFDGTLGARVGLLRYGNSADFRPQGWQLDVEGAAFIRQDPEENSDVDGYDFRIGIPLTYGVGNYQMKFAWYHTSAHIGDEYQIKHPDFVRINFSRNALVWGHSYYFFDVLRVYGEVDFGYWTDGGNEPWAFQFGLEYSPLVRGARGAPFFAVNGYLREEVDFGGSFLLQTGWQWRGQTGGQLLRAGFQYYTGPSWLDEFYRDNEQLVGGALWYDF